MTEDQIKHMVNRFLGWRLPSPWHPDGGISFKAVGNEGTPHEYRNEPTGTNLFDATQADTMVRHMAEGLPPGAATNNDLLLTPEYARLCGIAAAASALASVYPERCTAPAAARHPENCHCGQVLLDRALRTTLPTES